MGLHSSLKGSEIASVNCLAVCVRAVATAALGALLGRLAALAALGALLGRLAALAAHAALAFLGLVVLPVHQHVVLVVI